MARTDAAGSHARPATIRFASLSDLFTGSIAFLIVQWGFIAGVLIGVIIGCATFAVSASRVNTIKFSFDGSEYRSSLDGGAAELRQPADRRPGPLTGIALWPVCPYPARHEQ